jgi:hypothetical protein
MPSTPDINFENKATFNNAVLDGSDNCLPLSNKNDYIGASKQRDGKTVLKTKVVRRCSGDRRVDTA